jgi:outer membrane protein assembly factor BamB
MFRGGPDHTGVYDAPMLSGFGGLGWRVQTRGTVRSRPTVQGATVYVGSGDGHLYAIDRESGETRWAFDAGSAVTSTPAVSGGLVFFGTYDDDFHAVWAADGRPVWTLETGPPLPFP